MLQTHAVTAITFKRHFLAACPQCGDVPMAPLATAFVATGHIRYVWACDRCSRAFGSSVCFTVEDMDGTSLAPRP